MAAGSPATGEDRWWSVLAAVRPEAPALHAGAVLSWLCIAASARTQLQGAMRPRYEEFRQAWRARARRLHRQSRAGRTDGRATGASRPADGLLGPDDRSGAGLGSLRLSEGRGKVFRPRHRPSRAWFVEPGDVLHASPTVCLYASALSRRCRWPSRASTTLSPVSASSIEHGFRTAGRNLR